MVTAWSVRGTALLELGQIDRALSDINQAVELAPEFPEARNNLGKALHAQGQRSQEADEETPPEVKAAMAELDGERAAILRKFHTARADLEAQQKQALFAQQVGET